MDASAASWEVGAQCRRLSWLLHASVVEAKHAQLARAFKAGFNPNQPRVPGTTAAMDGQTVVERTGKWSPTRPSRSLIDSPENLVRIPTLKHWQITGWYMTPNEDYGACRHAVICEVRTGLNA